MATIYLSIHKAAKMLGVTPQTLRNWERSKLLVPAQKRSNGYRYYSKEQLDVFMEQYKVLSNRINIGYCRVSTPKQKEDLKCQCNNIELYLKSLHQPYKIIEDVGSGINYTKKGLTQLLELICNNKVDTIYVLYKDRLVRFGFELIKQFAELHNTNIIILDSEDKTVEQELMEDLMQIVTVFSCKLHGKRANKTKKIMEELLKEEDGEKLNE